MAVPLGLGAAYWHYKIKKSSRVTSTSSAEVGKPPLVPYDDKNYLENGVPTTPALFDHHREPSSTVEA